MENKVNLALIGFLVIILSLLLVAILLWLTVGTEKKSYQTYQTYIKESVSGLNVKAPVKYRGVEVGFVRDIALVLERPNEIKVLLDIEQNVPMKQDTHVILSTQGLTGLSHIELTGGSRDQLPPIRQPGQRYPELPTKPSLLVRLDTAISGLITHLDKISNTTNHLLANLDSEFAGHLLTNINQISQAIPKLLSAANTQAIGDTLHNFQQISQTLAARTKNMEQILLNAVPSSELLKNVISQLPGLLVKIENSLKSFETASQAFTKTASTINQVVDSSQQQIVTTTKTIEKTADQLRLAVIETRQDMNYFTRQALPEVANTLQQLHVLLVTFRHLTQELERKPNMLLFGKSQPPRGPGE